MGVSKNRGKTPKMDGENKGKPYEQMDDLGGKPIIFGNTHIYIYIYVSLGIELQVNLVLLLKRADRSVHPEFWKFW